MLMASVPSGSYHGGVSYNQFVYAVERHHRVACELMSYAIISHSGMLMINAYSVTNVLSFSLQN